MEVKTVDSLKDTLEKNNLLMEKMMQAFAEHSACKEMLDKEVKDKFFNKFTYVVDRMLDNKSDEDLDNEFRLEDLYEELDDFLEDSGLEYFKPKVGDKFNRKFCEAKRKIETQDQELDSIIEKVIAYGYKLDGIIIKPAKVSVYKYIEKKED